MIKVSPSILAADIMNLDSDIRKMVDAGCDWLHIDIMDGHFVPNLSYGPSIVRRIHESYNDVFLDVHLMMENPKQYIQQFADCGASLLTVHAEIQEDVKEILHMIRDVGLLAGLSIKPGTPVESIRHFLPLCDLVLVMTVEPGFGGQSFREECIEKLSALRRLGFSGLLECDGGVNMNNIFVLAENGLDVAVMGTAMYRSENPTEDIKKIHNL